MVQAVVFDMDGTLIDSEPFWKMAEQQVFSAVGVKITDELAAQTAAMTTKEVTTFWYQRFPWRGKSLEQVENEVVDRVYELIIQKGKPMRGVASMLEFAKGKGLKIGLATNAPKKLIPAVLEKLDATDLFHETASSEDEAQGKPHPAVYLSVAKKLGVEPLHCIAFEDSYSGLLAATRAGMKTVVVPYGPAVTDNRIDACSVKLENLADFSEHHWKKLSSISSQAR